MAPLVCSPLSESSGLPERHLCLEVAVPLLEALALPLALGYLLEAGRFPLSPLLTRGKRSTVALCWARRESHPAVTTEIRRPWSAVALVNSMPAASLRTKFWRRSFLAFASAFLAAAVFASASSRCRFSSGGDRCFFSHLVSWCVAVSEWVWRARVLLWRSCK